MLAIAKLSVPKAVPRDMENDENIRVKRTLRGVRIVTELRLVELRGLWLPCSVAV